MQHALVIISIVLFSLYLLLLLFYRQSWMLIPYPEPISATNCHTHITIIIPARNEEVNIRACLESVCRQTYPKHLFEVLVVDDHSTDNTAAYVREFEDRRVKLIALKDFSGSDALNSYKKKAIETAILLSSGELIVTTDADCTVPVNWLRTIAVFYEQVDPV